MLLFLSSNTVVSISLKSTRAQQKQHKTLKNSIIHHFSYLQVVCCIRSNHSFHYKSYNRTHRSMLVCKQVSNTPSHYSSLELYSKNTVDDMFSPLLNTHCNTLQLMLYSTHVHNQLHLQTITFILLLPFFPLLKKYRSHLDCLKVYVLNTYMGHFIM